MYLSNRARTVRYRWLPDDGPFWTAVSTATASAAAGCADLLAGETSDDSESTTATDAATALIDDLANGAFERASERFVEGQRNKRGAPARLERLWMGYTTVAGAFDGIDGTSKTTKNGVQLVDLTLPFDRGERDRRVAADGSQRLLNCAIADAYERPSYVDPNAIAARDVKLAVDGCSLRGTATTPTNDDGAVPGVVLVRDSGPSTRNTAQGGTKGSSIWRRGSRRGVSQRCATTSASPPAMSGPTRTPSIASPSTTRWSPSNDSGASTASIPTESPSSGTASAAGRHRGSRLGTAVSPASSGWVHRRDRTTT